MKIKLLIIFLNLVCLPLICQVDYSTSCTIADGNAIGFVNNRGDSFTIDGYVWFYFYDISGNLIDSEDDYEYEYVSWDKEEIESVRIPSRTHSCVFEVREAVKCKAKEEINKPCVKEKINYTTSCKILDGKAYGYAHRLGDSFTVDGDVRFYIYDSRGDLIDTDDEYEYEYVSDDTEEIEVVSISNRAATCSFDISKALKR